MSTEDIRTIVIEVLQEVQTVSGRDWTGIDASAAPVGTLDGFDSLCAVEATVLVEEKLGCRDLDVHSIFVTEDGKRALTVDEIAHRISRVLASNGGKA
jgi:acyl carrier protein